MILGGSGSGKTNLIEYCIGCDLVSTFNKEVGNESTIVVIDSQRQLIPKLADLSLPSETITYLNPKWDMGLNLFDVGYSELKGGVETETAINKAVGLIRFVLEGTLDGGMTDRQRVMFDYAIQLVITIPGGNMITFINLLDEDGLAPYGKHIAKFDDITQSFFNRGLGFNGIQKNSCGNSLATVDAPQKSYIQTNILRHRKPFPDV